MKNIFFILFFLIACAAHAQNLIPFGGTRPTDTAFADRAIRVNGMARFPLYATSDTNKVVGIDVNGFFVLRTKSNSGGSSIDTTSLSNRINERVKYSDTAAMLLPYASKSLVNDTAAALRAAIAAVPVIDTTSLSARINQRVRYVDTAAMLAPYATKTNLADTSATLRGLIIASVVDTASLSARINLRVRYADTASMLLPYATNSELNDTAATLRTALIGKLNASDTASLSNRINQKQNYADTNTYDATNYRVDTAKANLRASINTKVGYADTAAMLTPYLRSASNGLTKTGQNVALGGSLTGATTITTTGSNTLAIGGLQGGTAADSIVVSDATTGELRRRASSVFGGGSWLTSGNSGLSTSNFIGNVDNIPLLFRTNNVFSGGVKGDPQYNTQLGYNMPNILNGSFNVNIGVNAGSAFSTIAERNIAIGRDAMGFCADPDDNVVIGYLAGRNNCTQSYNVVIGSGSDIRAAGVGRGVISNFLWWDDANAASGGSAVAGGRGCIGTNTPDATALLYVAGQFEATNITASSATPTVTLGAGAGTGATFSITGSNNNYTITVNTGTTPAASAVVFTISGFLTASVDMAPIESGGNLPTKNLTGTQQPLLTGTTTTHVMTADTVPLSASTTYIWKIGCTPKL